MLMGTSTYIRRPLLALHTIFVVVYNLKTYQITRIILWGSKIFIAMDQMTKNTHAIRINAPADDLCSFLDKGTKRKR